MEGGPAGGARTAQGVLQALYAEASPTTFHRVFGHFGLLLGAAPVPVPVQSPVPPPPLPYSPSRTPEHPPLLLPRRRPWWGARVDEWADVMMAVKARKGS
jgi:hypothetical protein